MLFCACQVRSGNTSFEAVLELGFKSGARVCVRSPGESFSTLDSEGTLGRSSVHAGNDRLVDEAIYGSAAS